MYSDTGTPNLKQGGGGTVGLRWAGFDKGWGAQNVPSFEAGVVLLNRA